MLNLQTKSRLNVWFAHLPLLKNSVCILIMLSNVWMCSSLVVKIFSRCLTVCFFFLCKLIKRPEGKTNFVFQMEKDNFLLRFICCDSIKYLFLSNHFFDLLVILILSYISILWNSILFQTLQQRYFLLNV